MKSLKYVLAALIAVSLMFALAALAADEQKAPPEMKFTAKNGNVTFNHAEHVKREKNNCTVCHDKVFPQSAKAPLNFKAGLHKPAETAKTSCASCHHAGGTAFETKGNCGKCHVKA